MWKTSIKHPFLRELAETTIEIANPSVDIESMKTAECGKDLTSKITNGVKIFVLVYT